MSETDPLDEWLTPRDVRGIEADHVLARLRNAMFSLGPAVTNIGRYQDLQQLGRGGMGVVYRAWDKTLTRHVALKLLRAEHVSSQRRLVHEARAMAQLTHANVVQVFDVDEHQGEAFVTMELVDGLDLASWLRVRPRSVADVLDVFIDSGRGLAAAHARGIVHRDFKPSNVMVGDDGRVRVTDFGLAAESARASSVASTNHPDVSPAERAGLTTARGQAGTPRYMAPEQRTGGLVTERADQWSFAAAVWESLLCRTLTDLPDPAPPGEMHHSGAPFAFPMPIATVLRQALSDDPHDRFVSMDALLAALSTRRTTGLKPRTLSAVAGVSLVGVVLAVAWPTTDDATAAAAPLASKSEPSEEASSLTAEALTSCQGAADVASAQQACKRLLVLAESAQDEGAMAEAHIGLARVNEHKGQFAAASAEYQQAAPLAAGAGRFALAIEAQIGWMYVAGSGLGQPASALKLESQARAYLRRLGDGHPDLHAQLECAVGGLRLELAEFDLALDHFQRAEALGVKHDLPVVVRALALGGVGNALLQSKRYPAARDAYIAQAQLLEHEADGVPDLIAARNNLGVVQMYLGALSSALVAYESSLSLSRQFYGSEHPQVAETEVNIGVLLGVLGRPAEGAASIRRARTILVEHLGRDSVQLARVSIQLAITVRDAGHLEDARQLLNEALVVLETLVGRTSLDTLRCLAYIASLDAREGHSERARTALQAALVSAQALGPSASRLIFVVHSSLGALDIEENNLVAAETNFRAALNQLEGDSGHPTPMLADSIVGLARVHMLRDEPQQAVELLAPLVSAQETAGIEGARWADAALELGRARLAAFGPSPQVHALIARARAIMGS
ncbi:MAG: protein kinase [Nannocystaceae bacterium]|nr:protein kinase [Nannocystaceae bacterium]